MSIAREVHNHLLHSRDSVRRTKVMNRQARIVGQPEWHDYGVASLNDAAIAEATLVWFNSPNRIVVTVEVRDAANPDITWTLTVEREIRYKVSGLRGGE